jgi:hypothetical protein
MFSWHRVISVCDLLRIVSSPDNTFVGLPTGRSNDCDKMKRSIGESYSKSLFFFSCARLEPLKENISRLPPCMLGRVFSNLFLHPCIAALKKPITFAKEFSGSKMLFSKSIFEFFVSVRGRTWGEFCMATQFLAIFVFEASRSAR